MTQVQALNSINFLLENLAALREFQPGVAAIVDRAEIPHDAERHTGRDGSETFRLPDESGRLRWMGATSMPSISAAELFGNVRRDQGNVLVPGVLSGREPVLVAQRLAPFAAVFVIESSPVLIRLALTLCDYRDFIQCGRIVFLYGDDLTETMMGFFDTNPGYEYPGHLFHAPHMTPAEGTLLRESVERAGESVLGHHALLVQRLEARIATQYAKRIQSPPNWDSPRVSLLSVEANESSVKSVSRIANAMQSQGWEHDMCIPNAPSRCHAAARLNCIAEKSPDIVLFANSTPKLSRALLPRLLPIVSWYLPGFSPIGLSDEHAGANDLLVASTPQQQQAICRAGLTCFRVDPATDASVFSLLAGDLRTTGDDPSVIVLMDLPQDGAAEMNLTLPSQIALWEALKEEIRTSIELVTSPRDSDILAKAERRSGTTLTDASLRETFEQLLATVVRPAARTRACVASLLATGCCLSVYGYGWEREDLPEGTYCGPIPHGDSLCRVFQDAQTVVFPVVSDMAIQFMLDALATGAHVVMGADDDALSAAYPGLCDSFEFVTMYDRANELAAILPARGTDRQVDAASLVASEHSFAHRLREILSQVQISVASNRAFVS